MIKQENLLASVPCDIEYDRLGEKEERKKIFLDSDYHRNNKAEKGYMRDDYRSPKGLQTCEFLVCSVLACGMYHNKNLKAKELKVLLHYYLRTEILKGSPNKVEIF